jgi:hypothetical protein
MQPFDFTDPGFWWTVLLGLAAVACFLYWIVTGARRPR